MGAELDRARPARRDVISPGEAEALFVAAANRHDAAEELHRQHRVLRAAAEMVAEQERALVQAAASALEITSRPISKPLSIAKGTATRNLMRRRGRFALLNWPLAALPELH
jgi:hypothetical protein